MTLDEAFTAEASALACVKTDRCASSVLVWQADGRCLVAPRAMEKSLSAGFPASAERGWPCALRRTGGDVTPQGQGVINLSITFRQSKLVPNPIAEAYGKICAPLVAALDAHGISATTGPVEGSYCDGDFNVVAEGLKFAGTALRMTAAEGDDDAWAVLGHAMMLVDGSDAEIVAAINGLYADAGHKKRVRSGVTVTMTDLGLERESFAAALYECALAERAEDQ